MSIGYYAKNISSELQRIIERINTPTLKISEVDNPFSKTSSQTPIPENIIISPQYTGMPLEILKDLIEANRDKRFIICENWRHQLNYVKERLGEQPNVAYLGIHEKGEQNIRYFLERLQ